MGGRGHGGAGGTKGVGGAGGRAAAPVSVPAVSEAAYLAGSDRLPSALSTAERDAIETYTMDGYQAMNAALRAGRSHHYADTITGALNRAIASGHALPGEVYRGLSLAKGDVAALTNGATFHGQGLMSTSWHEGLAKSFMPKAKAGEERVFLRIAQRSAVPIGKVSVHGKREGELLMRHGTKFTVTGRSTKSDADGTYHEIHVREN